MNLSEFLLLFTSTTTTTTTTSTPSSTLSNALADSTPPYLLLLLLTSTLPLWRPVGPLLPLADERRWLRRCRMSYPAFAYLVEDLAPHVGQDRELAVAVALNRLASGSAPAAVAGRWGVTAAAVEEYTCAVISALERLYATYVVAPTGARLERIGRRFWEEGGVAGVAGAIGAARIGSAGVLQGVCDAEHVFWDVSCGEEARMKASELWRRLCEGEVLREPVVVQGRPIRPFLVGNGTYPLRPFLMKPFDGTTEAEIRFNTALRKAHASIVTTFGLLKNRWKILKSLDVELESASQTVAACCVLHNFCQLSNQAEPRVEVDDDGDDHSMPDARCDDAAGEEARRALFLDWLARHP